MWRWLSCCSSLCPASICSDRDTNSTSAQQASPSTTDHCSNRVTTLLHTLHDTNTINREQWAPLLCTSEICPDSWLYWQHIKILCAKRMNCSQLFQNLVMFCMWRCANLIQNSGFYFETIESLHYDTSPHSFASCSLFIHKHLSNFFIPKQAISNDHLIVSDLTVFKHLLCLKRMSVQYFQNISDWIN